MKFPKEFIPKLVICFKEGYHKKTFLADLIAGCTVAIIALPLSIAFAIASGSTPEKGILTAILAGGMISLLGGSRYQVGGPTGAFVVIIADILARRGVEGLLIATVLGGIILVVMGLMRLGNWMKMIPLPLVAGVTTAIAIYIFTTQIPFFFGLELFYNPPRFLDKWSVYLPRFLEPNASAVITGSITILFALALKKWVKRIPWGIGAIILTILFCKLCGIHSTTLFDQYGNMPVSLPIPEFSFSMFRIATLQDVFFDAVAIAILAGLESLLTAMIADTMTGGRHKPNCELFAQGIANITSGVFGGLPATGAFARTASNVHSGAKTPVAGIIHAVVILLIIYFFSPLVSQIPLASLSGVLFVVCWYMADIPLFKEMLKSNSADKITLLSAFFLTLFVDLSVGITLGMIISSFAFIKKISDKPLALQVRKWIEKGPTESGELQSIGKISSESKESVVFELEGPLFYAVSDHIREIWNLIDPETKKLTIHLDRVSYIDATGLQALKDLKKMSHKKGIELEFLNPTPEVKKLLKTI